MIIQSHDFQFSTFYETIKYGIQSETEWLTDLNILTAMAEMRYERYQPEDLRGLLIPHTSHRTLLNLGLENTTLLANQRLSLTPALRLTHIRSQLNSETTPTGARLEELNDTRHYWSPQIGARYQALNWLTFKSNLNRYVREPSFFELFGDRGYVTGNLSLKAEKGTNWDLGLETQWSLPNAAVDRLAVNLVYFQSHVEDLITRAYDARGVGRSVNISHSRISGLEAGVFLNFLSYFSLTGHVTLQEPRNTSDVTAFDGKQLPGRYARSWLGRLEAQRWGARVHLEYLVDQDMYFDSANLLRAADREELNLGLVLMTENWRLNAEVKNLQNRYYEDFYRYPMPGRSAALSLTMLF